MKVTKAVKDFWDEFCRANPEVKQDEDYQVWSFGDSHKLANELYKLVLEGKKTATACLVWENEHDPTNAPILNGYSVITDFEGKPKCIIKTLKIEIKPFNEVDEVFAAKEGEGDLSLTYWKKVHLDYFTKKCQELGKQASETMLVVCEEFKLLYF
jgi:uncharacterized protein YhfF